MNLKQTIINKCKNNQSFWDPSGIKKQSTNPLTQIIEGPELGLYELKKILNPKNQWVIAAHEWTNKKNEEAFWNCLLQLPKENMLKFIQYSWDINKFPNAAAWLLSQPTALSAKLCIKAHENHNVYTKEIEYMGDIEIEKITPIHEPLAKTASAVWQLTKPKNQNNKDYHILKAVLFNSWGTKHHRNINEYYEQIFNTSKKLIEHDILKIEHLSYLKSLPAKAHFNLLLTRISMSQYMDRALEGFERFEGLNNNLKKENLYPHINQDNLLETLYIELEQLCLNANITSKSQLKKNKMKI